MSDPTYCPGEPGWMVGYDAFMECAASLAAPEVVSAIFSVPICVLCLKPVPLDIYLATDHTCIPCGDRHCDLLDGLIPPLKD